MKILPFYFEKFDKEYLLTNQSGAYTFLKKNELDALIYENFDEIEHLHEELLSKAFITFESNK